jgi:hypothetical protein
MAIALQPKFPLPNRSKQPVRSKKDESGVLDIGWSEGVLSDGRAFRAEMWTQDQISLLTIFFSTKNMEELDGDALRHFVESEAKHVDDIGNELWSVNIVVGNEDGTFISDSVPIFPYSNSGEPSTLLNPIPIKGAHLTP